MDRRSFLALLSAAGLSWAGSPESLLAESGSLFAAPGASAAPYGPGRIDNEYSRFLPGEREALAAPPQVGSFSEGSVQVRHGSATLTLAPGGNAGGWQLLAIAEINGVETAIFEKHVTHRGAIAYVTGRGGTIALIPKGIGDLAQIKPRPTVTPGGVKLERREVPGPDIAGQYILRSDQDPCYENVAALGPEYIGWSLVANEDAGPLKSIYLTADGTSRQPASNAQNNWAPDLEGALFDPERFLPFDAPHKYAYQPGYSKRTLLGGYLPVADTGVWNSTYNAGYEVMMLLPPGADAMPMARVRVKRLQAQRGAATAETGNGASLNPVIVDEHGAHAANGPAPEAEYQDHYWNCTPGSFFSALEGIWNRWHNFYEDSMPVEIPDPWLLDSARAGITLSRCSYRGLEPTYQVGEGAYTKIPERSHALFPVAQYEFIWAHQLWGLTAESDPYFTYYLDHYILPDGNFLYNTQDQVEGPLNVGLFLWNQARAYAYTGDLAAFERRLPTLERMLAYVLARYEYGKQHYPLPDRRYGLIWGSPEADLGATDNDSPASHPFYFQNATCIWRGLTEHARALDRAAAASGNPEHRAAATRYHALAEEMRQNIQRSLAATIAAGNPAMREAVITPFEPNDTARKPTELSSYENHRFMQDFFLSDWGDPALDLGHLKHRALAGEEICGLHTDGDVARTSNFMAHGTLAVRIRQPDYRPFLLTLYALVCYAADSGNRYAPEDAYIPGSYPGEQSPYGWSAVINSTLQSTLGLRWLLCYEESDQPLCHLQKAAPKHWFAQGQRIAVRRCPTRFGPITWTTEALTDRHWKVTVEVPETFSADLAVHIHPPDGSPLRTASAGTLEHDRILLPKNLLAQARRIEVTVS
jgi:hypothetical protein